MTGRGIDQILPDSVDPRLYESYVKDARVYVPWPGGGIIGKNNFTALYFKLSVPASVSYKSIKR